MRSCLKEKINSNSPAGGLSATSIPGVKLFRSECSMARHPLLYPPSISVVVQGHIQLFLGEHSKQFNAANYLISSVPMPLDLEIQNASSEFPTLGLSIELDHYQISQLLIDIPQQKANTKPTRELLVANNMTHKLQACFIRLLDCLENEMDRKVLVPLIKKEILYEVLKSPNGEILKSCVTNHASANRIAPVMHFINKNVYTPINVEKIAQASGMSPSVLYDYFKQATSMSPIQYVKCVRLHKARSLIRKGNTASHASYLVGYSSPSQFSREFKRFFGNSPRDVQNQAITNKVLKPTEGMTGGCLNDW